MMDSDVQILADDFLARHPMGDRMFYAQGGAHLGGSGLFWRADWLRLLADVGFEASAVRFDHSELDPGQYEILVGKRPA